MKKTIAGIFILTLIACSSPSESLFVGGNSSTDTNSFVSTTNTISSTSTIVYDTCIPKSCEDLQMNCGMVSDTCGHNIQCGHCGSPNFDKNCGISKFDNNGYHEAIPNVCGGGYMPVKQDLYCNINLPGSKTYWCTKGEYPDIDSSAVSLGCISIFGKENITQYDVVGDYICCIYNYQ